MARQPIIPVRADAATKAEWEAAARRAGSSLSVWMRDTLNAAAGWPSPPAAIRGTVPVAFDLARQDVTPIPKPTKR